MTEPAAKRQRLAQAAAEMVAVRVVALLESKNPDTGKVLTSMTRVSVSPSPSERTRDIAAVVAVHNSASGRGGQKEMRAGAPHWRVVAYVGPVTKGSTLIKQKIARLHEFCCCPDTAPESLSERVAAIREDVGDDCPSGLLVRAAAAVSVDTGVDFHAVL